MKENSNKPLLVKIPETGQYLDVRPLINYFESEKMGNLENSVKAVVSDLEKIIETLNCHFVFDAESGSPALQQQVFCSLYGFKELFGKFTVVKS